MIKHYCDRCNAELGEKYKVIQYSQEKEAHSPQVRFELCQDCALKFEAWVKGI